MAAREVTGLPQNAFQISLGVLLGVSLFVTVARTVIQMKNRHKFLIDDMFLFFAAMCLCVGTGLAYMIIPYAYIDGGRFASLDQDQSKLIQVLKITGVFYTMTWTATFAAKLSVLFFFKSLVERIPNYNRWVKGVIFFNLLVWAFCVCIVYILCPHFSKSAFKNCLPPNSDIVLMTTVMGATLDISTDITILAIPILILWKSQMDIEKKLGVGAFLMMNVWLIMLWPLRLVLVKPGGSPNLIWTLFFQFIEPNLSIMVASFSAFRSLFVRHRSKSQERREQCRTFKKSPRCESQVELGREMLSSRDPDGEFLDQSERTSASELSNAGVLGTYMQSTNVLSPSRTV